MHAERIRLVIVDTGGTIVDGPVDLRHIYPDDDGRGVKAPVIPFYEALKKHGMTTDWATIRKPMGLFKRDHLKELLSAPDINEQFKKQHGRGWTEEDVDKIFADFNEILEDVIVRPELTVPIPGAKEAIDEWRAAGILTGNTTGYTATTAPKLNAYLEEHYGLYTDYPTWPEQVKAGRPYPWMIFKIMSDANIYPPAAVVKIGDTKLDIAEGINAGVWTIGVYMTGNNTYEELLEAGADFVVPSIAQCPGIIYNQIEPRLHRGDLPGQTRAK
jgi:phosphonoacetaldehyde hydrolase